LRISSELFSSYKLSVIITTYNPIA
jgi:hypothetical protein